MKKIDDLVISFHQKPFYTVRIIYVYIYVYFIHLLLLNKININNFILNQPPQYHASIAWAEDKTIINEKIINQFKEKYLNNIKNNLIQVQEVQLKIGYKLTTITLT